MWPDQAGFARKAFRIPRGLPLRCARGGGRSTYTASRRYSTCDTAARGGDLGKFSPGQMVTEFDDVVFGLEDTGGINLKNDADIYAPKCGSISQTRRPGCGGTRPPAAQGALPLAHGSPLGSRAEHGPRQAALGLLRRACQACRSHFPRPLLLFTTYLVLPLYLAGMA